MRERGFTLLEMLIVLAIVGGLAFAGGNALQKMRGSRLRDSTTEVASSLRWAFDRSLAIGKHHRVAIRLGSNKWWVERCERRLPLRRGTDPEEEREREEKAEEERLKRAAEALAHVEAPIEESAKRDREEAAAAEEGQPPPPWCADEAPGAAMPEGAETDAATPPCCRPKGAGKIRTLKKGISFESVDIAHLSEPVIKGEAKINFFSVGYAEKSVILIKDSDADKTWAVTLEPLTGRVRVMTRPPRDDEGAAVRHDAAGKEAPEK